MKLKCYILNSADRDCEDVEEIYNDEHVYWMMINGVIQPVLCIYKNGYKYTVKRHYTLVKNFQN